MSTGAGSGEYGDWGRTIISFFYATVANSNCRISGCIIVVQHSSTTVPKFRFLQDKKNEWVVGLEERIHDASLSCNHRKQSKWSWHSILTDLLFRISKKKSAFLFWWLDLSPCFITCCAWHKPNQILHFSNIFPVVNRQFYRNFIHWWNMALTGKYWRSFKTIVISDWLPSLFERFESFTALWSTHNLMSVTWLHHLESLETMLLKGIRHQIDKTKKCFYKDQYIHLHKGLM